MTAAEFSPKPSFHFLRDLWDLAIKLFGTPPPVNTTGDLKVYEKFGDECLNTIFTEIYKALPKFDLVGVEYRTLSRRFLPGGLGEDTWSPLFYGPMNASGEYDDFLKSVYEITSFPYLGHLQRNWFFVCYGGHEDGHNPPRKINYMVSIPYVLKRADLKNLPADPEMLRATLRQHAYRTLDEMESLFQYSGNHSFFKERGQDERSLKLVLKESSDITLEIMRRKGDRRYILFIPTYVRDVRIGGMVFMGISMLTEEECNFLELASKNVLNAFRMIEESATQKNILLEKEKENLRSFLLHRLSHNIRHPFEESIIAAKNVQKMASSLAQSLDDIMYMINQTLASLITGMPEKVPLRKKGDQVVEFLDDLLWLFREKLPRHRKLMVDNSRIKNVTFIFDGTIIREVLRNLINNSIRYATGDITITAYLRGKNLIFEVSDIGNGIPDELRPRLWEPKFREVIPTSQADEGRGLGLWICKQLMKIHGVDIEVASKEEYPAGARFRVTVGESTEQR